MSLRNSIFVIILKRFSRADAARTMIDLVEIFQEYAEDNDMGALLASYRCPCSDLVTQYHLPWQSATVNLSPGRVAQSMLALLLDIGTPADPPKSRGKSPGRFKGFKCTPRTRYPVARKTYSRPKKPKENKTVVVI